MKTRFSLRTALLAGFVVALTLRAPAAQTDSAPAPVPDARTTAPLNAPTDGEIRVAVLLSASAEVVDFAGPWGVFDYVYVDGRSPRKVFKRYTVAATKDPVNVSSGMIIVPSYTFADAPAPHVIVIPAMDTDALAPAALDWLRAAMKKTDVTMSVCNGSFVLAKAGLLDGKKATAHHGGFGSMRAEFPQVNLIRGVRYVEDGKIATAGGLTSGTDLALRVVERYFGREVAKETAFRLEYQGTGWMHPESNAEFAKKVVATPGHPVCPVCEMRLSKPPGALSFSYKGEKHYFCGEWCKDHFVAKPERFLAGL